MVESLRRPRERVWIALADLFLDTDVRIWYVTTVRTISKSPFSLEELKYILDREVTPALQGNLLDIAGEWAGFDDDWVVKAVALAAADPDPVRSLVDLDHHWSALAHLITIARATQEDSRADRFAAWNALFPLFLDKKPQFESMKPPPNYTKEQLRFCFNSDLKSALIPYVRELAERTPVMYPTEAEVEANWNMFYDGL